MSLVFGFNKRKNGSYLSEPDKVVGVNTNAQFSRQKKGLSWEGDGSTTKLQFAVPFDLNQDWTVVIWQKPRGASLESNWHRALTISTGAAPYNQGIAFTTNRVLGWDGGIMASAYVGTPMAFSRWYCTVYVHDVATKNIYTYINGVLNKTTNYGGTLLSTPTHMTIGWGENGAYIYDGYIPDVEVYDHAFSVGERARAYREFLDATPVVAQKYVRYGDWNKAGVDRGRGLVASYNMIPSSGTLVDISGNGNNGTLAGIPAQTREGMHFDGVDDKVVIPSITLATGIGEATICVRFKQNSTGVIFPIISTPGSALKYIEINSAGALLLETNTNGDLASANWTQDTQIHDIVITADNGTIQFYQDGVAMTMTDASVSDDLTITTIGNDRSATFADGEFYDLKIYSRAFTEQEAINYHNQFARRVVLKEDFALDPVGSALPHGWIAGTGTYEINELATQDAVLKELDVGVKYLECTGAGLVSVPNKLAFGELELFIYRDGLAYINFIADRKDVIGSETGYLLQVGGGANVIKMFEMTGGASAQKFTTANNYVDTATWYGIKITRTLDGEFSTYVKGGAFGDSYILVDGGGSNPFTDLSVVDSEYIVLDFDVGDRIALINWQEGVIQ